MICPRCGATAIGDAERSGQGRRPGAAGDDDVPGAMDVGARGHAGDPAVLEERDGPRPPGPS